MLDSKPKLEGVGRGHSSTQSRHTRNSTGRPGFKAPTEGLKDIVFDTGNPFQMSANFRANVKALVSHIGTTFRKVPHVTSTSLYQIKASIIDLQKKTWGGNPTASIAGSRPTGAMNTQT